LKIAVCGLWHLGSVTSACMASLGFSVLGYDPDIETINRLNNSTSPVFEPNLNRLIKKNLKNKNLLYTNSKQDLKGYNFIWITYDTPVNEKDIADCDYVYDQINSIVPFLADDSIILISSQLPIGSIKKLENRYKKNTKKLYFAYSPENLRLGNAVDIFLKPDRIILGSSNKTIEKRIVNVLKKISQNIIPMSSESAEMTKHAINSFLACSVTFANELALICEFYGADANQVAKGLKSEERIGPKAYLSPGGGFSGGTLARDINFLINISKEVKLKSPLLHSIKKSNVLHSFWCEKVLLKIFRNNIKKKKLLVLGLAYKSGTNTLRRSASLNFIKNINKYEPVIFAFDPLIKDIHKNYCTNIFQNLNDIHLERFDAVIFFNKHDETLSFLKRKVLSNLKKTPFIVDQNNHLTELADLISHKYISVGRSL